MAVIVADLGNSRLKLGRVEDDGALGPTVSLPLDDPARFCEAAAALAGGPLASSRWWVASVNPPVAARIEQWLEQAGVGQATWVRSAAEVPIARDVEGAETGGADRALLLLAAASLVPAHRPVLVVSCGTAITIETIDEQGVWRGGSIGPGLRLTARALHLMTAQLPEIKLDGIPAPRGRGTVDSLEAGVFWGVVGGIRELLERQTKLLPFAPVILWTGGDADRLANAVDGPHARIEPNLVLRGLALLATAARRP